MSPSEQAHAALRALRRTLTPRQAVRLAWARAKTHPGSRGPLGELSDALARVGLAPKLLHPVRYFPADPGREDWQRRCRSVEALELVCGRLLPDPPSFAARPTVAGLPAHPDDDLRLGRKET